MYIYIFDMYTMAFIVSPFVSMFMHVIFSFIIFTYQV